MNAGQVLDTVKMYEGLKAHFRQELSGELLAQLDTLAAQSARDLDAVLARRSGKRGLAACRRAQERHAGVMNAVWSLRSWVSRDGFEAAQA